MMIIAVVGIIRNNFLPITEVQKISFIDALLSWLLGQT